MSSYLSQQNNFITTNRFSFDFIIYVHKLSFIYPEFGIDFTDVSQFARAAGIVPLAVLDDEHTSGSVDAVRRLLPAPVGVDDRPPV